MINSFTEVFPVFTAAFFAQYMSLLILSFLVKLYLDKMYPNQMLSMSNNLDRLIKTTFRFVLTLLVDFLNLLKILIILLFRIFRTLIFNKNRSLFLENISNVFINDPTVILTLENQTLKAISDNYLERVNTLEHELHNLRNSYATMSSDFSKSNCNHLELLKNYDLLLKEYDYMKTKYNREIYELNCYNEHLEDRVGCLKNQLECLKNRIINAFLENTSLQD